MPFDGDEYRLESADLESCDVAIRASAIMEISRLRAGEFEDRLITMLRNESSESVRRHIVRALGNLESKKSVDQLIGILGTGTELIVGDAAGALGRIGAEKARRELERLCNCSVDWIANQARYAIRQIDQKAGRV